MPGGPDSATVRRFVNQATGLLYPIHLVLPQVRGAWYFSSVNAGGDLIDTSGHGKTLTNAGTTTFAVDEYLPYASLNGSTQYFSRGDEAHFDITGDITLISIAYFDNTASGIETIVGKWNSVGGNASYILYRDANGKAVGLITDDGSTTHGAISTTTITSGAWAFCAMRFTASSETAVFLGFQGGDGGKLEKVTNTTSVPASIFNGNGEVAIGALNTGGTPGLMLTGRVGMTYVCAAALSDDILNQAFAQTRRLPDV